LELINYQALYFTFMGVNSGEIINR